MHRFYLFNLSLLLSAAAWAGPAAGGAGGTVGGGGSGGARGGGMERGGMERGVDQRSESPTRSGAAEFDRPGRHEAPGGDARERGVDERSRGEDRSHAGSDVGRGRDNRGRPASADARRRMLDRGYRGLPSWQRDYWDRHHDFRRPIDWKDIDWRCIEDNDYRRWLYFHSFYRYYPYPVVDVYTYTDDSVTTGDSEASYERTKQRITSIDTDEDRGEWIAGHYVEVPVEQIVEGETVEVFHPAVFRRTEDNKLEQLEAESTSREPKVRIVLTRKWIEGHYANDPPPESDQ